MPHQCLKCGKIFEEGSSSILKGCSNCNGNRFFFTKEPLNEKEREAIYNQTTDDINTKIMDILGIEKDDIIDEKGKWITMKPNDVRKAIKQHLKDESDIKSNEEKIIEDKKVALSEEIESDNKNPETINIEKPGKYRIDIKGLLEEEPIIIQKDGSYTIHLPSIFKMLDKDN
jgi:predicted  nucleic acid-binding Zn-ribbon protein